MLLICCIDRISILFSGSKLIQRREERKEGKKEERKKRRKGGRKEGREERREDSDSKPTQALKATSSPKIRSKQLSTSFYIVDTILDLKETQDHHPVVLFSFFANHFPLTRWYFNFVSVSFCFKDANFQTIEFLIQQLSSG